VHVCVVRENTRALGFYERLGFIALDVEEPGPVVYLGRTL
jgi:ribosomal protein S18 acetylase RimI-like enzyme